MQKTEIQTKKYFKEEYFKDKDLLSRWLALMEGIEYIEQKAIQLKINKNVLDDMMKPLALQKYINERFNSIKSEIEYIDGSEV